MAEKILMTWSGGKDSAMALYEIQKKSNFEIGSLLTTISEDYRRISMHGIREELLDMQVKALGYDLEKILISKNCPNEEYDSKMHHTLQRYYSKGTKKVVFGDIFLHDVRKYREQNLAKIGMEGIFPLWGMETNNLAHEFIDLGFKATVTCVDSTMLDGAFVGRMFDEKFLDELPSKVDPCGENGEFHTFVWDGPIFSKPISFELGDIVLRDSRFFYCDLKFK
jgi:uncharacterized protein (TIGR00290 family)